MPKLVSRFTGYSGFTWTGPTTPREVITVEDNLFVSVSNHPGENNPLGVSHFSISGSLQNGEASGVYVFLDNPSAFYDRPSYAFGIADALPTRSPGSYARDLEAATNPSRPDVKLPAFLFELKDIPNMVREMGALGISLRDNGPKKFLQKVDTAKIAKANLAIQFGWRPYVQDLWKLVTFADAVNKRMDEIRKLSQKGGLRRTFTKMDTAALSWSQDTDLGLVSMKANQTVKGTMVWKPTYPGSADLTPDAVRRIVTGTDAGNIAANVWELLPWSWFTDYFYNVGKMIQGGNRTVATPEKGWIIRVRNASASHPGYQDGEYKLSPGSMTLKVLERWPANPTSNAGFPTLGAGQLSILGSLAVTKNRKALGH